MIAFGLTVFGWHLNWWESLLALLLVPSSLLVIGELFD